MSRRREYLGAVVTGLAAASGGCLSDGGEGPTDDEPTDSGPPAGEPTETAEGTETGESGPLEGTIDITGSGTVFPLAQAVSGQFKNRQPDVSFSISPTGTGSGFSDQFCRGESDFNNASRPITAAERDQCADNGVDYHEIRLATDAVTVVVNTDNDWVDCITTDDLREIWRADGATRWSDVRSDWPDEEIERFGPTATSGTFDYFSEAVLGENASHTSVYESTERYELVLQGVESDRHAVGYLGFASYNNSSDEVKALAIETEPGCVEPSLDTAESGEYPLSRSLYTYVNTDRLRGAHVAEFARFVAEQSANESLVADEVGYVPNSEAEMQEELDALNDAIDDAQSDGDA